MRLLFLSSDKFPPFRPDVAVLFGDKLAGRGHAIDWVLQAEQACSRAHWTEWSGGRVWVGATDTGSNRWHRLRKHLLGIAHSTSVFPLLRQRPYDLLLVKDKALEALPALVAARRAGVPFLFWLSYPFPEASIHQAREGTARYPLLYRMRGHIFFFLLYRLLLPRACHVFVQSEQMRRDLASYGLDGSKMTPVPMGVQLEEIPFIGYDHEGDAGSTLVYLGTLLKLRKLDFLIRVLVRVHEHRPDAQLLFIGGGSDPSDEEFLQAEAARLGVADRVTITGFLPRQEAWSRMAAATVCLSPYYPTPILNSTSPTKLIEYMAMGKAVVANDHPEQRLVLEKSRAGMVVPWDEERFAAAICDLLAHPQTLAAMGQRGRDYVQRFRTYDSIADLVEAKLIDLASTCRSDRP
ncbi:MAG: glycosyltransferase family 4 protein [Chloroflexota bacterium]